MNNELIVTAQHRNRTKEHLKTALIQLIKKKRIPWCVCQRHR